MGDTAGELAYGLHFLRLTQLLLRRAQFRQVTDGADVLPFTANDRLPYTHFSQEGGTILAQGPELDIAAKEPPLLASQGTKHSLAMGYGFLIAQQQEGILADHLIGCIPECFLGRRIECLDDPAFIRTQDGQAGCGKRRCHQLLVSMGLRLVETDVADTGQDSLLLEHRKPDGANGQGTATCSLQHDVFVKCAQVLEDLRLDLPGPVRFPVVRQVLELLAHRFRLRMTDPVFRKGVEHPHTPFAVAVGEGNRGMVDNRAQHLRRSPGFGLRDLQRFLSLPFSRDIEGEIGDTQQLS